MLETVAGARCPCGHLSQRHRKPSVDLPEGFTGKLGGCRDCECNGLIEIDDWEAHLDA